MIASDKHTINMQYIYSTTTTASTVAKQIYKGRPVSLATPFTNTYRVAQKKLVTIKNNH